MEDTLTIPEEVQTKEPQQQDPPSKKLYNGLVGEKLYSKSYDEFKKQFSTPESINKLHKGLVEEKLYSKGSDDFITQYFPEKKNESLPLPSESSDTPAPSQQLNGFDDVLHPFKNVKPPANQPPISTFEDILHPFKNVKEPIIAPPKSPKTLDETLHPFRGLKEPPPQSLVEARSKDKNVSGNLWNNLLKGFESMQKGASDIVFTAMSKVLPESVLGGTSQEVTKLYREEVIPEITGSLTENIGAKVTTEQEKNFNDNFVASAVGGLVQSLPAILSPKGAKVAALLMQAHDGAIQTINSTEEGKALPENVKTVFGLSVGGVQAAFEKVGLDKIFGKQSSKVATNLAVKTLTNLIKKSKVPITAEVVEQAIGVATKSLKKKLLDAGGKIGSAGLIEFTTGSLQEVSTLLAEEIVNKSQDKQVFEPTTWGEKFGRVLYAGGQEAVGGGILGVASLPFSQSKNYIAEKITNAKTPEDIQNLKAELMDSAAAQKLSETEAQELSDTIDKYIEVNSKIPETVSNRKEVVEKIIERDELIKDAEEKAQQLETTDIAFHEPIKQDLLIAAGRVEELNNEIVEKSQEPEVTVTEPTVTQPSELKNHVPPSTVDSGVGNKKAEIEKNRKAELDKLNLTKENIKVGQEVFIYNSENEQREPHTITKIVDGFIVVKNNKTGVESPIGHIDEVAEKLIHQSRLVNEDKVKAVNKKYDEQLKSENTPIPDNKVERGVGNENGLIDNNDGTGVYNGVNVKYKERSDGTRIYTIVEPTNMLELSRAEQQSLLSVEKELNDIERVKRSEIQISENNKKPISLRFSDFPKSKNGEATTIRNYVAAIEDMVNKGKVLDESTQKDYDKYKQVFPTESKPIQNEQDNKAQEIKLPNTETKESTTNTEPNKNIPTTEEGTGEGGGKKPPIDNKDIFVEGEEAGNNKKEFDKMTSTIPNGGEVKKYLSGETIVKYEPETELRNNQEIIVQELEPALRHGVETIEKAKEIFGDDYVTKTLDYIERENINPENKALLYVSLENEMSKRLLGEPDNAALKKLQDLVRTKSQAFLRSNSLAINMGRLRKFAETGYDISKVTAKFFTSKEQEQRQKVEKLVQADAETIQKQYEENETIKEETAGITPDVEKQIAEGVEKEINKIYEKLPQAKKNYADKAIKALEDFQKKLRNKTYDASLGIPVAIIDAGITTIKLAIKAGVHIADAIELGINKIKEKYGKEWAKEDEFRKDMAEGFKASGIKEDIPVKKLVKDALIEQGFGKEITVTVNKKDTNGKKVIGKDGKPEKVKEKRQILDWTKLAGEERSVDKISANVAKSLEKSNYTKEQLIEVQKEFIDEYNRISEDVIQKGLNEIAERNKTTVTPDQKSAAKKLAEMYNYGLFDKDLAGYEIALAKTIGIDKLNETNLKDAIELSKSIADLFTSTFQGKRLTEPQMRSAIQVIEDKMRYILHNEAKQHGSTSLRIADLARTYMDLTQRMTLNSLKQATENPLSGKMESFFSSIGYAGEIPAVLNKQNRKMARDIYKEMVLEKGTNYGDVSSTFVNKGNLEMELDRMTDNKLVQAIASTVIGRTTLDAVDSAYKAKITQQKFTYNLLKILQQDRMVNGKLEKGMTKDEARNYVAEKLTGQSFKDAQTTAKEIIDRINKGSKQKVFNDSNLFVDRLATDIVNAALVNGEKISADMVTAAYNSAYKAAGRGLGHVANNFISRGIASVSGKIESDINEALRQKEYRKAATLTVASIFFRNIANPFVGGGTNWVVLKAEKSGLGLLSGLGSMYGKGAKMDLMNEAGARNLEKALYQSLKIKDKFIRGAIGGATTVLAALIMNGITTTDEYRKWRLKNMWAVKYLDLITPEIILATMAKQSGKTKQYLQTTFNKNENFDKGAQAIKAIVSYANDDGKASGKTGELIGSTFGAPTPWRLIRDGDQLLTGISGGEPYKVDNRPSETFMQGYFKGGMIDYIGLAPKQEDNWFTKEQLESESFKTLENKEISIPKEGTIKQHPIDVDDDHPNGLMTDEEFKIFNRTKAKYLADEIKYILNNKYPHKEIYPSGMDKNYPSVLGKDLPKKFLQDKIEAATTDITKRVKKEMFPPDAKKIKTEYKSEEEREKEKIKLQEQLEEN